MSSMESQAASTVDDDYANPRGGNNDIVPVEKTTDTVPTGVNQDGSEDSDEQLQADDREAIDQNNIIDERTRGAGPKGGYQDPGDTEGLPEDDGTSSTR